MNKNTLNPCYGHLCINCFLLRLNLLIIFLTMKCSPPFRFSFWTFNDLKSFRIVNIVCPPGMCINKTEFT
ncbi:hypothetical protein BpHYR1_029263 [Brachionus plicatilis]|uniref:Uncharacterized protein n=1 Tax=Brachionus plicatilis TaxID=10195 RepID=A0A3M7P8R9_BRAPC|nr:hypothetical protein BpHYR1_029263 [Brachionus plicatilis]